MIEYLLNHSRAQERSAANICSARLGDSEKRLPFLQHIVGWAGILTRFRSLSLRTLNPAELHSSNNEDDAAFGSIHREVRAFLKPVHLQHDMVVASDLYARGILNITENDRLFSAKLFFAYGLGNGLYFPLSVGATSILLSLLRLRSKSKGRSALQAYFVLSGPSTGTLNSHEGTDLIFRAFAMGYPLEGLAGSLFERFKSRSRRNFDGIDRQKPCISLSRMAGAIRGFQRTKCLMRLQITE
jgi:hypothetical protein